MAANLTNDTFIRELVQAGLANATTGQPYPARYNVVAKATSYTVLPNDPCGTLFLATATATFTLPAPVAALAGVWYRFANVADADMLVASPSTGDVITTNDLTANSVAASTSSKKIGAVIEATCLTIDGGTTYDWLVCGVAGGDGVTYTVAT